MACWFGKKVDDKADGAPGEHKPPPDEEQPQITMTEEIISIFKTINKALVTVHQ